MSAEERAAGTVPDADPAAPWTATRGSADPAVPGTATVEGVGQADAITPPATPESVSGAPEAIRRLADDLLPALVARLDASDLGELEVRTDAWRIRLRKPYERRVAGSATATSGGGAHRAGGTVPGSTARGARTASVPGAASAQDRRAPAEGTRAEGAQSADVTRPGAERDPRVTQGGFLDIAPGAAASAGASAGAAAGAGPESRAAGAGSGASAKPAVATSPAVGYFVPREGWTTGRRAQSGDVIGYVDCLGVRQEVLAPVDGFIGRLLAQSGEAVEYGQPLIHLDLPGPAPDLGAPADAGAPAGVGASAGTAPSVAGSGAAAPAPAPEVA